MVKQELRQIGDCMASKNKKNKVRNSYIDKGAEKNKGIKCKRLMYYTKADRQENKKI